MTYQLTEQDIPDLICGLSVNERRFILAASKHPKKWAAIWRDGKLSDDRIWKIHTFKLVQTVPPIGTYILTPLGVQVKAYLLTHKDTLPKPGRLPVAFTKRLRDAAFR